jgi:hypothetical protein
VGRNSFELKPIALLGVSALSLAFAAGCDDLARFTTAPDEAYCGSVTLANEFREGLSPRVQMRLRLDGGLVDGAEPPGTIATFEAASVTSAERRLLVDAALRPILPMQNDPLSRLEFGEGRDRNLVFSVTPADPEAAALLAVVSLKSDDNVEVRLVRPGAEGEDEPARKGIFGIFPLLRRSGDCGF